MRKVGDEVPGVVTCQNFNLLIKQINNKQTNDARKTLWQCYRIISDSSSCCRYYHGGGGGGSGGSCSSSSINFNDDDDDDDDSNNYHLI